VIFGGDSGSEAVGKYCRGGAKPRTEKRFCGNKRVFREKNGKIQEPEALHSSFFFPNYALKSHRQYKGTVTNTNERREMRMPKSSVVSQEVVPFTNKLVLAIE